MLTRMLVLCAVLGVVGVAAPSASADLQSFQTTLKGRVTEADGNCCGFYHRFSGKVRPGAIPGVERGTYEAFFWQGDFDFDTCGVNGDELCHPRICDVRADLPGWCAQRYDLDFYFTGPSGTLNLNTTYEGFGWDDWWPKAFTWEVTEGTGPYADWAGSGTYSFGTADAYYSRAFNGRVRLTLTGLIGPS
jgi:hypothetical protein